MAFPATLWTPVERRVLSFPPLAPDGSVIDGSKKAVTDGPFTEGKEIVGGYLIIKANDHAEAVNLSKDCPVLEHEGSVEVRELLSMTM